METNRVGNPITRREFVRTTAAGAAGAALTFGAAGKILGRGFPPPVAVLTQAKLPYAQNALEPHISAKTMSFHYGKHHAGYVTKANRFLEGTKYKGMPIADIIVETAGKPALTSIFNNVAQIFNHTFFWNSMKPDGGGKPKGKLAGMIDNDFGSYEKFVEKFTAAAKGRFGSGWAWLAADKRHLKIMSTANADNPLTKGMAPLLTIDVWEHAYYLDYQNRRGDFVKAYIEKLINWDFAEANVKKA